MTYLLLNAVFLVVAVSALLLVPKNRWPAYLVGLVPMVIITAIFDNLIVATGIVAYDPNKISGLMIGWVPIEDFAYTLAAVLIVPSVWSGMTRRRANALTKLEK